MRSKAHVRICGNPGWATAQGDPAGLGRVPSAASKMARMHTNGQIGKMNLLPARFMAFWPRSYFSIFGKVLSAEKFFLDSFPQD